MKLDLDHDSEVATSNFRVVIKVKLGERSLLLGRELKLTVDRCASPILDAIALPFVKSHHRDGNGGDREA